MFSSLEMSRKTLRSTWAMLLAESLDFLEQKVGPASAETEVLPVLPEVPYGGESRLEAAPQRMTWRHLLLAA